MVTKKLLIKKVKESKDYIFEPIRINSHKRLKIRVFESLKKKDKYWLDLRIYQRKNGSYRPTKNGIRMPRGCWTDLMKISKNITISMNPTSVVGSDRYHVKTGLGKFLFHRLLSKRKGRIDKDNGR